MAASIVVGFLAVRRRDIRSHRAWMIRAYAIGLGAGTQAFTIGFGEGIFGTTEVTTALCHAAAWVINLAVAERAIPALRSGSTKSGQTGPVTESILPVPRST